MENVDASDDHRLQVVQDFHLMERYLELSVTLDTSAVGSRALGRLIFGNDHLIYLWTTCWMKTVARRLLVFDELQHNISVRFLRSRIKRYQHF
eukprot:jgi/Mesen1/10206/ME000077S09549